jgi:DNA-directed RNA polymerase subunit RPC12/RpoP
MTTALNQMQIVSAAQEKNKMLFDHEPLSASTQRSSRAQSLPDDCSQSSSEPSSAGQHALRPCIYIALRCSRCGSVRHAIAELPAQAVIACPECSQECTFVLLGLGLTSRSLPFHQVLIVEPTRWDSHLDSETNSS